MRSISFLLNAKKCWTGIQEFSALISVPALNYILITALLKPTPLKTTPQLGLSWKPRGNNIIPIILLSIYNE
jgi:hypothetical protein